MLLVCWRDWVKGIFCTIHSQKFTVTGSQQQEVIA